MKTHYTISALALLAAAAPAAQADDAATVSKKLEELVVVSSRIPTPLRYIGTSVSVVTKPEIEQLGYNSLYNVLRTQPGVGVSNQGGPGSITSLRIRGEENYRTRFYLDGIDISDTSSPQTTSRVEEILSSSVERVEILRGPQGLMYGADAGGVVSISTIAPQEGLHGALSAEAGRYGSQQYAANINGGNSTVDFAVSAARYESDLFNAKTTDVDLRDDDGYDNTTLHGRLGWNVTDELRISVVGRDVDSDNAYDGCYLSDDCTQEFEQQSWRAAINYNAGRFQNELFHTENDTVRDNFTDGLFSYGVGGKLERTGYIGSFEGDAALKLVYGMELQSESVDSNPGEERDQKGYYAEYQGDFNGNLFLTAGARYDDNDDFGSTTTYRLSSAYLLPVADGEMKFRATYGTGFRAPSLSEIAINESPYTLPPAFGTELEQEESEGFDLAVSWTNGTTVLLEVTYFDQEITDEIFYDFNSFGYLQKSGETRSQGVELYGQWDVLSNVSINGNYTYTDSQDIDGEQRARRPENVANLGIVWRALADRLVVGVQARVSEGAIDVDGTEIDDYEVIDLNASYALLDDLALYARIENATDEDYEEVPTYNSAGAAGYVGVRYSF